MTENMTPDTNLTARQGIVVDASDPDRLRDAVDLAFHYRGDVTITCRSTDREIDGYVFDRLRGATDADLVIRMIARGSGEHVEIRVDDIAQLRFSGRDTAEGKSFDSWMKKFVKKKLAGETASIESDSLDEA
jgi:hypothetical protein